MAGMIDIASKTPTSRKALARGSLRMGRKAFALLKAGRLPKGNPLPLAEAAGILAAKRAPQAIPLCHPLPLESVELCFDQDPDLPGLHVFCEARAFAKTGVEMEALSGALGALLAVYDVVKQVDAALSIENVRLEWKEGGKKGTWRHPRTDTGKAKNKRPRGPALGRAATITVSDRCFRGRATDFSGKVLQDGLKALGFQVAKPLIVPDEPELIRKAVERLSSIHDLVALTGGTGLSPRDVTPETVAPLCDRLIPGIAEALRAPGQATTPLSALSRSVAGQRGRCLIVCLPGSKGGVRDGLAVLAELLPHALGIIAGEGHG
jgi:molybdenum cofactor biosynthesis protein MoaC